MTEKEFLNLFNDIDDKFIDEEQESTAPVYPVKIQYPEEAKPAVKGFSWGGFPAVAAVCVFAVGGIFAAGQYFGNGDLPVGNTTTVPYQTVTEYTSADVIAVPETEEPVSTEENPSEIPGELPRDLMPVLYETTLNCNGKSYTLTALMHRIYQEMMGEAFDGTAILYGDVALELSLDGEVKDTLWVYGYGSYYDPLQRSGVLFGGEFLGSDYFRVLDMEQDVLAFFTPGDNPDNDGALLDAMFITVDKEDKLTAFQRFVSDEEQRELDKRPVEELAIYDGIYFKSTPDYDIEARRLILHLLTAVENPWWENGLVFSKGDIPLSFDFDNYTIKCEDENYRELVNYIPDTSYPPLTVLDGSYVYNSEILKHDYMSQGNFYHYSLNCTFAVPFFTSADNRTAGEKGEWQKIKGGMFYGDYYIKSVVTDYSVRENNKERPFSYQCVVELGGLYGLSGELNCTAAAEKLYNSAGEVSAIKITLDREYCEGMPGLEPCVKGGSNSDKDFDDDRACFILTEKMKNYYKVFNSLNGKDSVRVSLSAKEFSLSYHSETGYTFDGMTLLGFGDEGYTLDILE